MENARNAVQGNHNFLKVSRGSIPPDPPNESLYLHCPHAPPTKNPSYASGISTNRTLNNRIQEHSLSCRKARVAPLPFYSVSLSKWEKTSTTGVSLQSNRMVCGSVVSNRATLSVLDYVSFPPLPRNPKQCLDAYEEHDLL